MKIKHIFLDVANTLIHKPAVWSCIMDVLKIAGHDIPINILIERHKLLSEIIQFPDKTNKEFYYYFNSELLLSLGIPPTQQLIENIFNACTYQPWKIFDDVISVENWQIPVGIISNWDSSLRLRLNELFVREFDGVFISQETGHPKPSMEMYKMALEHTGCISSEVLYIGDSLRLDIIPALTIGFQAALIDRYGLFPGYRGFLLKSLYDVSKFLQN